MAVTVLKNISQDEINWYHESRYWMHVSDEKSMISSAFKEGQESKAIEDAKKLLADGKYTAEEISELLKIPVETFV